MATVRGKRRQVLERVSCGDTADADPDPLVRDRSGQTLLHLLPHLDHEFLFPWEPVEDLIGWQRRLDDGTRPTDQ